MPTIDFVYAADCPNVKRARANLMRALSQAGAIPRWREYVTGAPETPDHLQGYSSPTILVDGVDIEGTSPSSADCCRFYDGAGVPPVAQIARALRAAEPERPDEEAAAEDAPRRRWLSGAAIVPGLGIALMPKVVCPLCWPAYAGVLGALGLGFLMEDRWLLPISAIFLSLALLALAWRAKARRGYGPLAVGGAATVAILLGKFGLDWMALTYSGVAALFVACVWNVWPKKSPAACSACPEAPPA